MASRVKKLFHRGKEDDGEQPPAPTHTRNPNSTRSDPALRTSLYESTMPGDLPQTGDYPVKGNDSSVALQHGRKSSSRSRRNSSSHHNMPHSSTTPNHYETSRNTRRMTPPPMVNSLEAGSYSPYLHAPAMPMGGNDDKRRDLPQDFSGLSLGNAAGEQDHECLCSGVKTDFPKVPTTVTQTVTTTRTLHQASNANPGYSRNNTGIRAVDQEVPQNPKKGQPYLGDLPSNSMFYADNEQSWQGNDDANSSERTSIPRKQVGSSVNLQSPSIQSSPPSKPQIGRNRRQSAPKPLPSTPIASSDEYSNTDSRAMPQQSGVLDRSRPRPKEMVKQEVVDRAKNNTHDTQVIESMAPGQFALPCPSIPLSESKNNRFL